MQKAIGWNRSPFDSSLGRGLAACHHGEQNGDMGPATVVLQRGRVSNAFRRFNKSFRRLNKIRGYLPD